jgi:hypothetical protein
MKNTTQDLRIIPIIIEQLNHQKISVLDTPFRFKEVDIQGELFTVYHATLSREERVFDAWIILGLELTGYYNQENYPNMNEALANHIGTQIISGACKVRSKQNAKRRNKV